MKVKSWGQGVTWPFMINVNNVASPTSTSWCSPDWEHHEVQQIIQYAVSVIYCLLYTWLNITTHCREEALEVSLHTHTHM